MNILFLGGRSPEVVVHDVDFARWFEHGGDTVLRLDPEAVYARAGMQGLEREVLRTIEEQRVRIVIYPLNMDFDFRPAFFRESLGHVYRILLLGDDEHYFDVSHRYYAQGFDLVLTTNPLCERYRLYGIEARFLPPVLNARVFSPGERRKEIDVSFVGRLGGKVGREAYVATLKGGGIALQTYGVDSPRGVIPLAEAVEVYRRSRINLNFTGPNLLTPLDSHLSINRRVRQQKNRCSMIALCGSFVLSEDAPGIDKLFEIGKEIDTFADEKELADKVRFYLADEQRREEMAARAHARAVREYDEAAYGRALVKRLETEAVQPRRIDPQPIYLDPVFWSGFGAWRMKYLVIFLFTARPVLFVKELRLLFRARRFKPYAALWFAAMGLLFAARTSSVAAWFSRAARAVRQSLRRPEAGRG